MVLNMKHMAYGLLLLLAGCRQPVLVDLDDYAPRIVVLGEMSADSLPRIYLSYSQTYFGYVEQQLSLRFVEQAEVLLSDGTASDTLREYVRWERLPLYYSSQLSDDSLLVRYYEGRRPLRAGQAYTVRVRAGEQELLAPALVPERVEIADAQLDTARISKGQIIIYQPNSIRVSYVDPPAPGHYYQLQMEYVGLDFVPRYDSLLQQWVYEEREIMRVEETALRPEPVGGGSDVIVATPYGLPYNGFQDTTTYPVTLRLITYGEGMGRYRESLIRQARQGGNPLSEPVILFTDVEGGLGTAGGQAVSRARVVRYRSY